MPVDRNQADGIKARLRTEARRCLIGLALVLLVSFAVRGLTAQFIFNHLNDPGWFQSGSYAVFDQQAQDVLDGKASFFRIPDSSRTDLITYPPGYPVWVAFIYTIAGIRSAHPVLQVQWVLDSLAVLLIVGIGVTAFGWRAGIAGGLLAALSPLMAMSGATPGVDAPTTWFVLGGAWMLLLSAKRLSVWWAAGAGIMLGIASWLRVNPLFLFSAWSLGLLLFTRGNVLRALKPAAALALAALLVISPVVIRNLIVFYPEFVPTGLNVGLNLWEGLGETNRAKEFGAVYGDTNLIEEERREMGVPPDAPFGSTWPDGIRRDRLRRQKATAVIMAHPVWFAGVMIRRSACMFKYFGQPSAWVGTSGINVTGSKCLPADQQRGFLPFLVNILGAAQSIMRHVALPLIILGVWFGLRSDWRISGLLLMTVSYYLFTLSIGHSELRYGLPMQAILLVFAGFGVSRIGRIFYGYLASRKQKEVGEQRGADTGLA
jgi:hypothetical protein